MLERFNPILRLVCFALVGLILYQLSQIAFKRNALARGSVNISPLQLGEPKKETNTPPAEAKAPTNSAPELPPGISLPPGVSLPPEAMAAMRSSRSRPSGRGSMPSDLPPEIQSLVEKIKTSQILGPDIKPPPMALLGIAGKDVFLRAPSGQTGLLREGEELGGVKLLQIGTNRVLVEENKIQKELTLFDGFGSETLLKKDSK